MGKAAISTTYTNILGVEVFGRKIVVTTEATAKVTQVLVTINREGISGDISDNNVLQLYRIHNGRPETKEVVERLGKRAAKVSIVRINITHPPNIRIDVSGLF